jgi:hypothetical protein
LTYENQTGRMTTLSDTITALDTRIGELQTLLEATNVKLEEIVGQKRQLDQLLCRTFIDGQLLKGDVTLANDWDLYLKGDISCHENFSAKSSPELASDDGEGECYSPAPLKRTMTCPSAPRKERKCVDDDDRSYGPRGAPGPRGASESDE